MRYTLLVVIVVVIIILVKAVAQKIIGGNSQRPIEDYDVSVVDATTGQAVATWSPKELGDAIYQISQTWLDGGSSAAACEVSGKQINTWIAQLPLLTDVQLKALNDYWNERYRKQLSFWGLWKSEKTLYDAIEAENTGFTACLEFGVKAEALKALKSLEP